MNKGIFRLVFDKRRGMQVPAAETARSHGKQKSGNGRRLTAVAAAVAAAMSSLLAVPAQAARALPGSSTLTPRANLPQAASNFNQLGRATQGIDASNNKRLQIDQIDKRVIMNWSSFDVGAGYSVHFNQPTGGSALNRIGSASPSVILGKIEANAEVILYNANGVLFGQGATVNTGNFIATTLNISDEQFEKGFRNITSFTPAFAGADGEIEGFIRVESGASITTANGGDIMLFAPRVLNEGHLAAPGGQVVLAAGQKVYLAASLDPSTRGFLVEVDPFVTADKDYNTVENAARGTTPVTLDNGELVQRVNEIVAERGSINMVGLAVKQMGTARATTAVKGENGAIYLLAHGKTTSARHANGISGQTMATAAEMGELTVGPQSVTRVDPDLSKASQLDAEPFFDSVVRLEGRQVHLQGGAQIVAKGAGSLSQGGSQNEKHGVSIVASATPLASGVFGTGSNAPDTSRIVIDPNVTIDVSGTAVDLAMSSNIITGRLFAIQLADSPLQRGGVLYRKEVSFDRRKGTSVADVKDFYNNIQRTAAEKLTGGGSITLKADGAVVVGQQSKLDVSGGQINFAGGELKTTVLRSGNRLIDIANARADVVYDEVITPTRGRYEPGYVEGKNAGQIVVAGRQVVLDGDLSGKVVAGRYQRGGTAGARPLAGRLQVGTATGIPESPEYYSRNLVLSQAGAPALSASFFSDPLTTGLGVRGDVTTLSAQAIQNGGFGRVELLANDTIKVDADTALNLGPGGSFVAIARHLDVDGAISAASGTIALNAAATVLTGATPAVDADVSVVLSSGARLSTAGSWTNDGLGVERSIDGSVATGGGSIKISAFDSVDLAAGSSLDVSAGAWRDASGKLSYGKAGSIDLTANAGNSVAMRQTGTVQVDGQLSGYGFSGGGSFKLASLDLTVSDVGAGGLWLKPEFFSEHGFENITLSSIRDLTIADNTTVEARLKNRALNSNANTQRSSESIASLTHLASASEVDDVARKAVNMTFAATRQPLTSEGLAGANLQVGKGTTVATEAGGTLSFSAGGNLTVAGTLSAPGGNIALTVNGARGGNDDSTGDKIGFLDSQALWLTDTAKVLAGGTAEYQQTRNGLRSGQVYGGGTVTLNAKHGYLVAESGSEIDIRGAEATFDVLSGRAETVVARDAGTLALSSPEGIAVDSTIKAAAASPSAAGGTLKVAISRAGLGNFTDGAEYSTNERKIVVNNGGSALPAGAKPGDNLELALGNGIAHVSAPAATAAGFAAVNLRADDRIEFAQDVSLSTAKAIELNTRVISGQGTAAVHLAAPYVALGDLNIVPVIDMVTPVASSGTASLEVKASLIDVVGTLGLQGFATTHLDATRGGRRDGEIRLRARTPNSATQSGALKFAGNLDMTAGQIVPTTFSKFDIDGLAGDSILRTFAPAGGSTSALPLSAFGELKLSADRIEHGGVVRAPFGSVEMNAADTLIVSAGSEISVSGAGVTVPVGTTVNGTTWAYYPEGASSGVIRPIDDLPVAKQVVLKSATLDVSPEARVSAAGGGDVQASEFISGAGGKSDYLANTKGLYAVLPDYAFDYAPHDAQIQTGTDLRMGEQIVITMPGSGLAPGRYTLLPAAYALLPGAVLVSKAADQGNGAALNAALPQTDGSTIVTGYLSSAGMYTVGDENVRYRVEPATTFRAKSEYQLTRGSDFFDQRAKRLGTAQGSVPSDAGRISLAATTQLLDWKAKFDLSAPAGASAGEFDLVAPRMVVVDDVDPPSAGHTAADGYTAVSANSLADTGAASILLGGLRSGSGTQVNIATVSDRVRVEADVTTQELMLAAKARVEVVDGVTVSANGVGETAAGQLNLAGDGAFVRVSNRQGVDLVRTGVTRAPGKGDLDIGANTTLAGAQVDIDATGSTVLDSTARLDAQSFGLGAGRIAFGGASPEGDSVVIDGTLLSTVSGASSLALRSYSTIDFVGGLDLHLAGNGRLLLDAAGVRGLGAASDEVNLSASEVLLRNSTGSALVASGQGSLNIEANPPLRDARTGGLEIGAGAQSLGFDKVTLASKGDLIFSGSGQIATQGDLDLVAERVTARTAADQKVLAGKTLTVRQPADGRSLGERVGLGAKLVLSGDRVLQNGKIDLPGGRLTIEATNAAGMQNAIEFGTGSTTRAGGFAADGGDGWTVYGDAGSIEVTAQQGAIQVDGLIDVAALAGGGNGGHLQFFAANAAGTLILGTSAALKGSGGTAGDGGSFVAELQALPADAAGQIDELASAIDDFTQRVDLRVRSGDLTLASQTLKAETVSIAADGGKLSIDGTVDARAKQGGVVQLAARDDVTLGATGQLLAGSSRTGANGGDVLLASKTGTVRLAADSVIDAGGDDARDGRVILRASRDASTVKVAPIAGSIVAGEIDIEAVKTYSGFTTLGTGTTAGTKLGQATIGTDTTAFMANQAAILSSLGVATDPRVHLRPGTEVAASGDFTVSNDWNQYSAARPGGEPGFLTLRAAGNLNVNGTISDGFNGVARNSVLQSGDAGSMRLVAGADLNAANPLAVKASTTTGDLTVAGGKLLRTSSGSIELAAGRDIVLAGTTNAPATVMVTGTASSVVGDFVIPQGAIFTSRGGRISVNAGRDIKSPASDQILTNWFFHAGFQDQDQTSDTYQQFFQSPGWWSRFDLFRHGFGSFGGGNIMLTAAGDLQNVSAAAPTSGRLASTLPDLSKLVIENGGDIEVSAGGNLAGGSFFVGRGDGSLKASGAITAGSAPAASVGKLAPVFALMDGAWKVRARGDAAISAVFNPTIFAGERGGSFYTFGNAASLDVGSTTGNVSWPFISANALNSLAKLPSNAAEKMNLIDADRSTLYVAPPSMTISAFSGDIAIDANRSGTGVSLYPAATGNVKLFAGADLALNASLRVMDNHPDSLPGVTRPSTDLDAGAVLGLVGEARYDINKLVFSDLHAVDREPVRIHADGSLKVADGVKIISPKEAVITAGVDITDLSFYGQHHHEGDLTRIAAGRNYLNRTINPNSGLISLAGPGTLEIEAGRQLNLGASAGVETVGNLYNTSLPESGASVRMAAGLDASLNSAGFAGFMSTYLAPSGAPSGADYRDDLVAYVRQKLNLPGTVATSYDEALAMFNQFSDTGRIGFAKAVLAEEFYRNYLAPGQRYADLWALGAASFGGSAESLSGKAYDRLRDQVMFAELKRGGSAGAAARDAAAKDAGYAEGYKALELAGYGAPFSFSGDIDLIESKVQTKSGGGIDFRAPGGGVNVGLSAEVSNSVGSPKTSDKRGVVAYDGGDIKAFTDGNFLVNAQKVFVIGQGDIMLWSSNANIDSGRGSNNTVTVPPLVPKIDPTDGSIVFELPTLATGSGIGILDASDGKANGTVSLYTPRGEVIALDAFIRAPKIDFDDSRIRGADNVIGVSVNPVSAPVTVAVGGLGTVPTNPAEATSAGTVAPKAAEQEKNSMLTVDVVALGDGALPPTRAGGCADLDAVAPASGSNQKDDKSAKADCSL